jgi:hypothetical protein
VTPKIASFDFRQLRRAGRSQDAEAACGSLHVTWRSVRSDVVPHVLWGPLLRRTDSDRDPACLIRTQIRFRMEEKRRQATLLAMPVPRETRPMAWNAQSALRRKALPWLSTERALCVTCRHLERAVAQRLEQRLPNPCVVGSSPSRPAKASHQGRFPQIFLSSVKSVPGPGLLAKSARYWIVEPARGRLQLVGGSRPGSSWSLLLNLPGVPKSLCCC